jgi:hypothetical protein
MINERNQAFEDAGAVFLYEYVTNIFPSSVFHLHKEKLIDHRKHITRRTLRLIDKNNAEWFTQGRANFVTNTVNCIRALTDVDHPADPSISLKNLESKFMSTNFDSFEMDFVIKLAVDPASSEWTQPNSLLFNDEELPQFIVSNIPGTKLPEYKEPETETFSPIVEASSNIALLSIPLENKSSMEPSTPGKNVPEQTPSSNTSFSSENYGKDALMYVIGESIVSNKSHTVYDKLIQAERILCMLLAKEGCTNIRDCVLGFVLMGPTIDTKMLKLVYKTLSHYRKCFPHLWTLQGSSRDQPCRFLFKKINLAPLQLSVFGLRLATKDLVTEVDNLKQTMEKRFDTMNERFDTMNERSESMEKRFDTMNERSESMEKRFEARLDSIMTILLELQGRQQHPSSNVSSNT